MAAHHPAPPTTAPPAPWSAPLHAVNHSIDQAIGHISHWLPWFSVANLATLVVIGVPLLLLTAVLRTRAVWGTLETRRQWIILPTSRFVSTEKTDETANSYKNFANALSHVRLRATTRHWWLRRAGALRIQLDTINQGGTIYSMGGPPWARSVVEVAGYQGLILVPLDAVNPRDLSPKGLIVLPEDQVGYQPDTDTEPEFPHVPVGDPQ